MTIATTWTSCLCASRFLVSQKSIHYNAEYYQDKALAAKYNIDEFPTLEFFKNQIPSVYDGELEKPGEVLAWINDLLTGADIEQVSMIEEKYLQEVFRFWLKFCHKDHE